MMKLFMKSLEESAKQWYRSLPNNSINSWDEFMSVILLQYEERVDPKFTIHELATIKKWVNELISDFNDKFIMTMRKYLTR